MATIRKRLLKNGKSAYDIQVKATDKGSGRQYVRTLCWHPDSDMSDKKADQRSHSRRGQIRKRSNRLRHGRFPCRRSHDDYFPRLCGKMAGKGTAR